MFHEGTRYTKVPSTFLFAILHALKTFCLDLFLIREKRVGNNRFELHILATD